jgi:hypothetical protein
MRIAGGIKYDECSQIRSEHVTHSLVGSTVFKLKKGKINIILSTMHLMVRLTPAGVASDS